MRLMRMPAGLLPLMVVVVPQGPARAAACPATLPHPDGHGITCVNVTESEQPDRSKLRDVTMTSTMIFQPAGGAAVIDPPAYPVTVRVHLPPGYDPDRGTPYRTLYLLHGGGDTFDAWTAKGDVVARLRAASFDGIVVMPTGGLTGWYTDWAGRTDGYFAPKWETYHNSQLVPWIDANFHTIADRTGRWLAGLSMGGFGALKYAAAHPGLYSAVGAFSPGIDLRAAPAQKTISDSMWQSGAAIRWQDPGEYRVNKYEPGSIFPVPDPGVQRRYRLETLFGPRTETVFHGVTADDWPAANPAGLVTQGRYAPYSGKLALYAGACDRIPHTPDGTRPAPADCGYDTTETDGATGVSETVLGAYAAEFDRTLTSLGVEHRYCYTRAGHDWRAWQAYLSDFLTYASGAAPAPCPAL
ncbi:alpha/beta hydrolase [Nonomuraea candida]|uniref:alpha/beta hydrolase n=1 Tax=Nonomuraea candida TaxID=359159 RepID=UPI000693F93F|nr:alpha/beta hydrolase-fold protein [Nonomuraea candida]